VFAPKTNEKKNAERAGEGDLPYLYKKGLVRGFQIGTGKKTSRLERGHMEKKADERN